MEMTGLGVGYDLLRSISEARSKTSEERQAKRLGEMQDAIKRLQSMPSPKQIAKQDSMSRVAMLKKRLDALKSMLLHASPEQARALAREVKSIAKELASVVKSLNTGGMGETSTSPAVEVSTGATDVTATTSIEAQEPVGAVTDSATVAEAVRGAGDTSDIENAQATPAADTTSASSASRADGRQAGSGDSDLRAMLQDAKELLKEVIAMLKAKMALAANQARASREEKQAKLDVLSAETSLANIDKFLSQGGSQLYSAQGELGAGDNSGGFAVSGLNVNVAA